MATQKTTYGGETAITLTLTSLANSNGTTAGARSSTVVDNTTDRFVDALVRVKTKGSGASNTSDLLIYAYAALGDADYTDAVSGTDADMQPQAIKNAVFIGKVTLYQGNAVVSKLMPVARAFGGVLPSKWGLIALNNSGAALSGTGSDHEVAFQGVKYDVE